MINVLVVAFEFPPLNSGGSHRPYKFVKYLSEFGINPIVITPRLDTNSKLNIDNSIVIDPSIKVIYTELNPPKKSDAFLEKNYFNIVDLSASKWGKHLDKAIQELLKTTKIDVLYVTAPPFSIAELGNKLSKKYNLPLILDLRDAWSHWVVTPYVSYLHYQLTKIKERKALKSADVIVATSDQTILDFQELYPEIPKDKYHLITNAFDENIPEYKEEIKLSAASPEKPIKIGYVGSFYYSPYQRALMFNPWWKKKPYQFLQYTPRKEDWLYRSPYFFFKTLSALKKQHSNLSSLLKVEFAGNVPDWLPEMIKSFDIEDLITLKGRMSHAESLDFQSQCDLLLITSSKVVGGQDYSIAGKTFEYICMKKPILAFVCEGAQMRLLDQTGMSINCSPDEIENSVKTMNAILEGNLTLKANNDFIKTLHIKYTSRQLSEIIKNLSSNTNK